MARPHGMNPILSPRFGRTTEVAFIDPGVSHVEQLLGGLRNGVEAIMLDASKDAVAQISEALQARPGVLVTHLIAHGGPGEVRFSSGVLSLETVPSHHADLVRIGKALGNR